MPSGPEARRRLGNLPRTLVPRDLPPGSDGSGRRGVFCISLDFELMWGAKEKWTPRGYGRNILREREVVPRMLDAFERNGIHATWATVGVLFCESKDELIARAPTERPRYVDQSYSSYAYLNQIGQTEREDPYHFAPSLLALVRDTPDQEIATHTFSHFYTLEEGGRCPSSAPTSTRPSRLRPIGTSRSPASSSRATSIRTRI